MVAGEGAGNQPSPLGATACGRITDLWQQACDTCERVVGQLKFSPIDLAFRGSNRASRNKRRPIEAAQKADKLASLFVGDACFLD